MKNRVFYALMNRRHQMWGWPKTCVEGSRWCTPSPWVVGRRKTGKIRVCGQVERSPKTCDGGPWSCATHHDGLTGDFGWSAQNWENPSLWPNVGAPLLTACLWSSSSSSSSSTTTETCDEGPWSCATHHGEKFVILKKGRNSNILKIY